jgi:hypothetical protein
MRHSLNLGNAALPPTPERDMLAAGIDIIPDRKNNLGAKRVKRGECPTCGLQTHKVAFLGKNKPLTVEGQVYKGRCLNCHPLEGYIRRPAQTPQMAAQHPAQHPEAAPAVPLTLEVGYDDDDDDDSSLVSGITMDMRLIQGARNWDPSQGVDYDSDDEPPTVLPNRRPGPSVGGDDPYADSRPDPDRRQMRPPRTQPSYTQSLRNLGIRSGGQSNRDLGGMPPRKPPPLPSSGQGPGRFPSGTQLTSGKSEKSIGTGTLRQPRDYGNANANANANRMDQKLPFQEQGYDDHAHQSDQYDYPNEQDEDDQNYASGATEYSSGNGPALDADGYPIANSNFGWNKEVDMLPPGGMDSLFNRRPSKTSNQVRTSITSTTNHEIEFSPPPKNKNPAPPAPAPAPEHQSPMLEVKLPFDGQGGGNLRPGQRISSMASGPMYQSDDFPTYVEEDIGMPGLVAEPPRLSAQISGPLFYASETTDDGRFQMSVLPPMLQASKTTGPDVFSRFQGGSARNLGPHSRPGMTPRIDSQNTSESSFAPPLISRNLRGRPDDDNIQDPMSSMPAPVGMISMVGRATEPPKPSGSPFAPRTARPMLSEMVDTRKDAYSAQYNDEPSEYGRDARSQFNQRIHGTESSMPYEAENGMPSASGRETRSIFNQRNLGMESSMPYGAESSMLPASGREARSQFDQRSHGMELAMPYEAESGMPSYSKSDISDEGPAFDDDVDVRNKFKYGTKRPSDVAPDYGRRDYGRDTGNNVAYGTQGPSDMGPAGDYGNESRNMVNYGTGVPKDAGSADDHPGMSSGSLDYDMGRPPGSAPAGDRGLEARPNHSNDMMTPASAFQREESKREEYDQSAYASSSAAPASDQVNTMLRKLSVAPRPKAPGKSKSSKAGTIHDIPAILHCLNLDEATPNLREKALVSLSEILWKSGEKARSFIVEHKGIETLVKTMWSDISDAKVQAAALAFLFSLSASPDGRASGDMLSNEESICDTLLFSMQTHISDPGIQLHGCAILACLASASSNNVKVSDGSLSGALLMVVNAMSHHSRSRDIQKAGLQALYYQCLLSTNAESNKRTLMESSLDDGGSGMDAVLSAMTSLQDDVIAVEWACRLCWCLTSSQDLVKSLAATSVVDVITKLCQRYMPDQEASYLMEAAFGVIANISYLENKRSELERLGVVPCLVDGLRYHPKDCGVNIEACSALANLAVSPHVRQAITHSGAVESIVQAMQAFADDEDLMSEAIRALVCLAIDSPQSKESIAMPDVLNSITQANKSHAEAHQLHEMSCALLASLAVSRSHSKLIVGNGGVDTIIQALGSTSDEKLRDAACLAYRNLACELDDSDEILQKGAINGIVNAMSKHGNVVSIQINACCTFWNLAYKTEREPGTIVGSEGIKNIVKAMQSHLESGELLELACGALWSLVDDSVDRKKDVVGSGAIDAVACAVVMHPDRVSTLEKAFGVLSNVSLERPLAEAIVNAQGVSILVEAMRNNGSSIPMLEVGSMALRNLIFQFPDYAPEASSVVSVIINAMKENPDAVSFQQEACNLLWVLAAEAENCQSKILALDGVAVVMKCMEIPEVQESALGAFRQLASGSNMSLP